MRILFLTHSFNSLTQRLWVELTERGHEVSIELDIADSVSIEAVELFRPDLVIAPFLKRAIPEAIWCKHVTLVVHPGIPGDRGPSALDWAVLDGEKDWGVTVLQAIAEMDAGPIWATASFPMREARKSSLYRNEVTEAAVTAVLAAVERFERGDVTPEPLDASRAGIRGRWRPVVRQAARAIDWAADDTATVLRKVRASDSTPGVLDRIDDQSVYLYDAHREDTLRGAPGAIVAQRDGAICRATVDGAVWITHLRRASETETTFKLPAAMVLGDRLAGVPEAPGGWDAPPAEGTWREIGYEERRGVGYLRFAFDNGAMSTAQCERLRQAFVWASGRDTRVLVLMGGRDFWSNGIHLNTIEAADSPADESWRNINAMDDLCHAVLTATDTLTVAAMQGNGGAGGVFMALAADRVVARRGVVLNPHYKNMGNLFGSEYWTYLLPRRVGAERAREIMDNRLPIGAAAAKRLGLIDDCFGDGPDAFVSEVSALAERLAASPDYPGLLEAKRRRRAEDEGAKPLAAYRDEELARMRLNFYGFDPSYHVARYHFVSKVPHAWTPLHLARHRRTVAARG
jgi:putative two-component system hydrogenase maturation factor HypX/HoxX